MQYSKISSVRRLRYFHLIIFIWFKVSSRGRLIQKMPSNEGLLVVLRWQINFDSDQNANAINGKTGRDRLFDHFRYKVLDFS
jgi:hypothetical protein